MPDVTFLAKKIGSTHISSGAIVSGLIGNAAIVSGSITAEVIGEPHIYPGSITSGKIGANVIGNTHLYSGKVQHARLGGVTAGQHHAEFTSGMHNFAHPAALIGTGAIISAKIAANAIGGGHILDGSIGGADLANQAVTSAKIGALAVGAPHIAALAIVSGKVASGGLSPLTSGKIWAGYTGNIAREENKPAGGATVATGTYSGNGADDRQITTGFKCSLVLLFWEDYKRMWMVYTTGGFRAYFAATSTLTKDPTDLTLHASDGFVVDAASANSDATAYSWWAISE